VSAEAARSRPTVHFTAQEGWINDPYGVAWVDGRYHLYYQAIPGRVTWGPNCHWGHARSDDLVHWEEQDLVLTPQSFEVGCWSGSVVDDVEPPVIFYTRVTGNDWDIGQVAIATYDRATGSWRTTAEDVVVPGPPPELDLLAFRDPNVFRWHDEWRMLLGASLPGGRAAVLQYSSVDLRHWTYDGVLHSRPGDPGDEVPTGVLWECPQLFPLGDRWVLVVSVWDQSVLLHVAAAVGGYDGKTFEPASWQRLTYGSSAYATTAFRDRDGRRCVLSWLREEPTNNPALAERAGAQSVVSTLALGPDGRLILWPHPDLDAALDEPLAAVAVLGNRRRYDVDGRAVDLVMTASGGRLCDVVAGETPRARLSSDSRSCVLSVERTGFAPVTVPLATPGERVRVLLDADILEIFTAGGYGAFRIVPAADPSATALVVHPGANEAVVRPVAEPAPRLPRGDALGSRSATSGALVTLNRPQAPVP
jgi:beta-fructofuranosidase